MCGLEYKIPGDTGFSAEGRGIYIVDITTGEVLAKKVFTATDSFVNGAQIGFDEMRYAFASAPVVFDLDYDGFADVVYIGDLGGITIGLLAYNMSLDGQEAPVIDGFTGAEWLSAYIGQIFYFRDRLVRLRDNIDGWIARRRD